MKNKRVTDLSDLPLSLTVPEVAAVLGIGRQKAYELVQSGVLPCIRIGRQIRVYRGELERFLKQN